MGEERRSGPRVRAYLPVRLRQHGTHRVVETLTKDLGRGGVRVLSPAATPVSTELAIELTLSTAQQPVRCRGRIAWFRTLPYSEQFDVGLTFTEISPEAQQAITAYLERFVSQRVPAPA